MSNPNPAPATSRAWSLAARQLERWRAQNERVDALLEKLPADLLPVERARVQALLYGAIRHLGRINAHLDRLLAHPPRPIVWAALLLAGYELLEGGPEGHAARVGHHAVEQTKRLASPKEAGLVNAVVRKLASALAEETPPGPDAAPGELARYHSHPEWLVRRWQEQWGPEVTRALLAWNQTPAQVFLRWRDRSRAPGEDELAWLQPVPGADGFFMVSPGHWDAVQPLLQSGVVQVHDPATRLAVDLLAPRPEERVLDLCAAPGGKSLALADRMERGTLVSVDLSGPRFSRLEENLRRVPAEVKATAVAGNLLRTGSRLFAGRNLPSDYSAVLIDVPCSNTGVMRHRVDVRWRLQPDDLRKHAAQQFALLEAAADLVAPGGRLVYSTCSLEPEENEQVVDAFVRRRRGQFTRGDTRHSRPWESRQDGAAAFLLHRSA